jgi:hypothetical protein
LSGNGELITKLLESMETNRKTIESDIATLTFYMQGGLNYNDAWMLTIEQRQIMSKVIEKHYEAMNPDKKSMM